MKKKKHTLELTEKQLCTLSAIMEWTVVELEHPKIEPDLRKYANQIHKIVKRHYKNIVRNSKRT